MWGKETLYWLAGRWAVAPARKLASRTRVYDLEQTGSVAHFFRYVRDAYARIGLPVFLLALTVVGFSYLLAIGILVKFAKSKALWPVLLSLDVLGAAALITIAAAIACAIWHEEATKERTDNDRALGGDCPPDGAPYNAAVVIRINNWTDRENFQNEFRSVPDDTTGVILVLRQARKRPHYDIAYIFESMRRQLEARNKHEKLKDIKVEWVCFENKHGTFEAYMPYARFEADILEKKNTAYAALLCLTDVKEFRDALRGHKDDDETQKAKGVVKPDTICGLITRCTTRRVSKKEALTLLFADSQSDVMLLSDDRKRYGIVTLAKLTERMFSGFTCRGDPLERLRKRIADWDAASWARAREIELHDIAQLPPPAGDDFPDYDSRAPLRLPLRKRPTAFWRFTRL